MPLRRSIISVALAVTVLAICAQAQEAAYLNPNLPAAERAHDLVGRMTLEEKASQLEDYATSIPRLGIPDYQTWGEALHGVSRAGYATVFPQAIGMGATWDPEMVRRMGNVVSTEARGKYNEAQREGNHRIFYGLTFWSPNINIFRDPRWGRGQETYGEDPFLTGKLGVAYVSGVQGEDLSTAVPGHQRQSIGGIPGRIERSLRPAACPGLPDAVVGGAPNRRGHLANLRGLPQGPLPGFPLHGPATGGAIGQSRWRKVAGR